MPRRIVCFLIVAIAASSFTAAQGTQETPPTESKQPTTLPGLPHSSSPVEILSDTKGVDFGPYIETVKLKVKRNWYSLIPAEALPPLLRQGTVALEFAILKDGNVSELHYTSSTGDVAMDRAAYGGITSSTPFAPLPAEFSGEYLRVRFTFAYNPKKESTFTERVRLSEILVSTQNIPPGNEEQIESAHTQAEALLAQIRSGISFEELAKSYRIVPSASAGGDLGFFRRGLLPKSIEDAVFGLRVGDVTDVIRTKQGFVILKVTEHLPLPAQVPAIPATK